ncbi:hypothetical protein [Raineya sp.]|jgi:hypothetical protein
MQTKELNYLKTKIADLQREGKAIRVQWNKEQSGSCIFWAGDTCILQPNGFWKTLENLIVEKLSVDLLNPEDIKYYDEDLHKKLKLVFGEETKPYEIDCNGIGEIILNDKGELQIFYDAIRTAKHTNIPQWNSEEQEIQILPFTDTFQLQKYLNKAEIYATCYYSNFTDLIPTEIKVSIKEGDYFQLENQAKMDFEAFCDDIFYEQMEKENLKYFEPFILLEKKEYRNQDTKIDRWLDALDMTIRVLPHKQVKFELKKEYYYLLYENNKIKTLL